MSGSDLEALEVAALACTKCSLAESRKTVVFGSGNPEAELMFIGEAPGRFEDEEGLPFVGKAGKLLDTLLGEVGMARGDVYIANVLKCRPPANRDPRQDEIEACSPWLEKQIALIDPAVICTLGNFATQLLLARQVGISRLRGQEFPYKGGRVIVPTYHPAALLRGGRGNILAEARSDFETVARLAKNASRIDGAAGTEAGAGPDQLPESSEEQLGLF